MSQRDPGDGHRQAERNPAITAAWIGAAAAVAAAVIGGVFTLVSRGGPPSSSPSRPPVSRVSTSPAQPGRHRSTAATPLTQPSGHSGGSLAGTYYGQITYTNGYTSELQLCSVSHAGKHISGNLVVWNGAGSGPFSGTIDSASHISFAVSSPAGEYGAMDFKGAITPDGTMSGTFVITNPRQQGSWNAHANPPFTRSQC
jgi:hypothetical protein